MSNQGRLMEFASLVYSPHRAEPPTRMPEPGASVFVSLSKRRTEPDSLRQFELSLGSRAVTSGFANGALQHNTLEQPSYDPRVLLGSYLPGLGQLTWLVYQAMSSLDG